MRYLLCMSRSPHWWKSLKDWIYRINLLSSNTTLKNQCLNYHWTKKSLKFTYKNTQIYYQISSKEQIYFPHSLMLVFSYNGKETVLSGHWVKNQSYKTTFTNYLSFRKQELVYIDLILFSLHFYNLWLKFVLFIYFEFFRQPLTFLFHFPHTYRLTAF